MKYYLNFFKERLRDVNYDDKLFSQLSLELADHILSAVKELGFHRYKFIVKVLLVQKTGQAITVSARRPRSARQVSPGARDPACWVRCVRGPSSAISPVAADRTPWRASGDGVVSRDNRALGPSDSAQVPRTRQNSEAWARLPRGFPAVRDEKQRSVSRANGRCVPGRTAAGSAGRPARGVARESDPRAGLLRAPGGCLRGRPAGPARCRRRRAAWVSAEAGGRVEPGAVCRGTRARRLRSGAGRGRGKRGAAATQPGRGGARGEGQAPARNGRRTA